MDKEKITNTKLITYLEQEKKHAIFLSKEDFDNLIAGPYFVVNNQKIYFEVAISILENPEYYQKVCRYFQGEEPTFYISYIAYGDVGSCLRYSKVELLEALTSLIKFGHIVPSAEVLSRYKYLQSLLSFDVFKAQVAKKKYNVTIDTIEYTFMAEDFLNFLELPAFEYDDLSKNKNTIKGVPTVHFFYALSKFIEDSNFLNEYLVSLEIRNRCHDIATYKEVDFEAVNKYLETTDTLYQKAVIQESLKEKILEGMDPSYDTLEKAIYIYIKMCKLLTYDEEYYAVNEEGPATYKHQDIDYVSTVTPQNNEVVCFEFNLLYTKMLSELGINFESNYRNMISEAYGKAHANCRFRIGKFLLEADATYSILQGDFMKAKLNQPLGGLVSFNKSKKTLQEFNQKVAKVYNDIMQLEANDSVDLEFQELLTTYRTITDYQEIALHERLELLIKILTSKNLQGIDSYSYIIQLKGMLFSKAEQNNNIKFNIIRNNQVRDKVAMPIAIISLNPVGFNVKLEATSYYYFSPTLGLQQVTSMELQNLFTEGNLDYISKTDAKIPGIQEGVNKK